MRWIFELIDRNGVAHQIDEPVGWDTQRFVIKRDPDYHGVNFEYALKDFEFDGDGGKMIREEYETYGLKGMMMLRISHVCGSGDIEQDFEGRISFGDYKPDFGSDCTVTISLEDSSPIMTFRNRIDSKVDLLTDESFDGTSLAPYTNLGIEKTMPGKGIFVQDDIERVSTETNVFESFITDGPSSSLSNFITAFFVPTFDKIVFEEIGQLTNGAGVGNGIINEYDLGGGSTPVVPSGWVPLPNTVDLHGLGYVNACPLDDITPILSYGNPYPNFHHTLDTVNIEILFAATVQPKSDPTQTPTKKYVQGFLGGSIYMCRRKKDGSIPAGSEGWQVFPNHYLTLSGSQPDLDPWAVTNAVLNFTYHNLEDGDRIYFFLGLGTWQNYVHNAGGGNFVPDGPTFDITYYLNSYIYISSLSKPPDTTAKVFMINEALSRVTEAITNDNMRVYSDYFGRTDAEPYVSTEDGCGGLEVILSGLFLRGIEKARPAQPPIMAVSFTDLLKGLNPLHNIGFTIEEDPNRFGYNRIRVENSGWFYQDGIIFSCDGVDDISLTVRVDKHYANINIGYNKWEAEQYNGIDEINTKHSYRTDLTRVSNTLDLLSTFVASSYAYEITRRLGHDTSEDWRYDNDTFILCMKRNMDGTISVEQGGIASAENIIDPDSLVNYRISPARMMLNWLPFLLAFDRQADASTPLIFTNGEGNFYAKGKQTSSYCNDEAAAISEKQNITASIVNSPDILLPYIFLEQIVYKYPLTMEEWKLIKQYRHMEIAFSTSNYSGTGWIDNLEYSPDEGIATFTLKPKRA